MKKTHASWPIACCAFVGLWSVCASTALATTCQDGRPVVERVPLRSTYCYCMNKDPKGTQVFSVQGLAVNVTTPKQSFSQNFAFDATVACDSEHLFVSDPQGADTDTHTFPLRESTVVLGTIMEQAVFPKDQPDARMLRLVKQGHARLIKTI